MRRALLLLALALSGCVQPPPDLPPLLALTGRACPPPPAPALGARTLDLGSHASASDHADLLATAPCLTEADGGMALFVAWQLKGARAGDVLRVDSLPAGRALLAPRLTLFDAQGTPTRSIPAADFTYRGASLASVLRLREGESFLRVASDPAAAGKPQDQIRASTTHTAVPAGPVMMIVVSGSEDRTQTVLSLNGRVAITLSRLAEQ